MIIMPMMLLMIALNYLVLCWKEFQVKKIVGVATVFIRKPKKVGHSRYLPGCLLLAGYLMRGVMHNAGAIKTCCRKSWLERARRS